VTGEPKNKANIVNSAELKELLGPPPVLSSEDPKAYDEISARLMECLGPKDFLEQLLIKQFVDNTWDSMRYARHKTLGIERKARQIREAQAKRAKAQALAQQRVASAPHPANELGRMDELEDTIENTVNDVDSILNRPTAELIHARALEMTIVYHLQLDQSLNTAVARRDDALEQLERYRRGLGKRLQRTAQEIIDAEFSEVAQSEDLAPSLVPSAEGSQ
jgi:hypothetical protein